MADVKWIKIVTDIFDDEKILLVESMPENDSLIVIWFKLLCLAGKQNNGGVFLINDKIPYTDEMLATIFRRPLNTVRLALSVFEQYGMIEIINGAITIPNWEKHQNIDAMEKIKEQTRKRVAAHREKQKLLADVNGCNVTVTLPVTQCNATDKIREDKRRLEGDNNDSGQKRKRFAPPTLDEVKAYCNERKNGVDAERFIDYYTANGWLVGKNKMKDWKAAVRTWERRDERMNTDGQATGDSGHNRVGNYI